MDTSGLLLCARYSSAPNFFGYCGPPKNSTLIDHLREEIGDDEVENILSQFDTLYLNLKLIAFENKIEDPFDKKVVEAYWIGNKLLNNIKNGKYVSVLREKFELEDYIGRDMFERLKFKFLANQTLPHHSFHVFNIFKRTGNVFSNQTIETMDSCRVGYGQVISLGEKQRSPLRSSSFEGQAKIKSILVKAKKLAIINQRLTITKPEFQQLKIDYKGKSFIKNLKIGARVSYHWGFVCDVLTENQATNLEFYTQKAINFYNL